jgi:hypothetical protein
MDLSALNASRTQRGDRPVAGLIGATFLEVHLAVIDYPERKLYLKPRKEGGIYFSPRQKPGP